MARWVSGIRPEEAEEILFSTPGAALYLAEQLAEMRGEAPIEEPGLRGDRAREFVRWGLTGIVRDRFLGLAGRRPLLAPADAVAIRSVAHDLYAGTAGHELAAFGATLLTLTGR